MPLLVVADLPDDDIPPNFISYFVKSGLVSDDTKPQFLHMPPIVAAEPVPGDGETGMNCCEQAKTTRTGGFASGAMVVIQIPVEDLLPRLLKTLV